MPRALPHDARLAARALRRAPGFSLAAVLTLALGIGLATAVYTVADAMLLRPLPVRDQDRVVVLWGEKRDGTFAHVPLPFADARRFAEGSRALEAAALAAYEGSWPAAVRQPDGGTSRLRRALVTGDWFDVLGARPLLGRALRPSDDVRGAAPVVVLSHGAWARHFGGDPGAVGRTLTLHEDGVAYTVVGVMPRGLDYPRGTELWAPLVPARTHPGQDSTVAMVDVVARLAPGATPERARDELMRHFADGGGVPWVKDVQGVATSLPRLLLGDARPAVLAFAAAAALLLLITCINVANLLVVRALGRARETAVRRALGASPGRVAGGLLAEHALLALAGGLAGVPVAWAAVRAFLAVAPAGLPRADEIGLDAGALGAALGITSLAMLVFGVAPALSAARVDAAEALRAGARGTMDRRSRRLAEGLVAGQVALALLVLAAAGLVGRSLLRLERADMAFDPDRLLVAELSLPQAGYETPQQQRALLDRLLPAVRALAGVRGASPVVSIPYAGGGGWDGRPTKEGQARADAAGNLLLNMEVVTPDYFQTLGLAVTAGRAFADADREGAPRVAVLSERAARWYFPEGGAVGGRLTMGPGPLEIVGVVPETRWRDLRDPRPSIYFPLAQSFFPFVPRTLAIHVAGDPASLAPALRRAVAATDPAVAVANAAPFAAHLAGPLAQPRLNALLLATFALAAVLLAAVGLFGVLATMVGQRTRELGVRLALGASPAAVTRLVLRRGLLLAAAGALAGVALALVANRLLASLLYAVRPTDAATLGGAALVLLAVAALASLAPARAGGRVEPAAALRAE